MIITLVFFTFIASSCLYYFFTTKFNNPRYYKLNTLRAKSLDIPDDKLITTRYSNLRVNKDIDTIIIGSGIGGLTTASLLAQTGRRVLVLEQHYIAGGCTHTFVDKKVEHESGIHYVGSIAYYLRDEITKIGKKYNLKTGKFIQRPIIGLVDYHKRNI